MKKKRARHLENPPTQTTATTTKDRDFDQELDHNNNVKQKKKMKRKNKQKNDADKLVATVSIAVPGSIVDNVQTAELKTRLAGQIARAATIFRIDEVVVFDNKGSSADDSVVTVETSDGNESGATFLVRILQYLETPQYLRRALFPKHSSLRFAGLLPPLDAPHHLRKHEWAPYREGVTLDGKTSNPTGTLVDVGLTKNVVVDRKLEPGSRVTVAMGDNRDFNSDSLLKLVPSSRPREEKGLYWGYKVRYAPNISSVFNCCRYEGGYDYLIGTSEHGLLVSSSELAIPTFRHLLISFGGLAGLEESIEEDSSLEGKDMCEVFDAYLNTCPHQGSRTIRTEEALFISLQFFQEPIKRAMERLKDA